MTVQASNVDFPEVAFNAALFDQINKVAQMKGYQVFANKSNTTNTVSCKPFPVSTYFNSRPDLVLYQDTDCRAYLVKYNSKEPEEEEEVTLRAESKLHIDVEVKVLGQLLAEMEKVAGDLAIRHLASKNAPRNKVFHVLEIFGFVID